MSDEKLLRRTSANSRRLDELLDHLDSIEEQLPIRRLIEYLGLRRQLQLIEESWGIRGECPFCSESGFELYFRDNQFVCSRCKKRGGSIDFLFYYRYLRVRDTLVMAAEILHSLSVQVAEAKPNT